MNHVKTILAFAFIFAILSGLSAQENTKEEPVYNQFKNEIGIDFQGIFSSSLGSSLVFKKHTKENRALRLQTSFRVDNTLKIDTTLYFSPSIPSSPGTNFRDIEPKSITIQPLIGLEWQRNMGRWQLFYGFDTGIGFQYSQLFSRSFSRTENGVLIDRGFVSSQKRDFTIPAIGFWGFKYFINSRISISAESSVFLGYSFSKFIETENSSLNKTERDIAKQNESKLMAYFDYLRFLNLSYYFD